MSEKCNHDCGSCSANCASREGNMPREGNVPPEGNVPREGAAPDFSAPANPYSQVKKVIGVVSGKGGVGKSMVTSLLSVLLRRRGHSTAVLDADITGPSIPKAFGIHEHLMGSDDGIVPAHSAMGVKVVSLNLLLENETDPVVWRGALIAGTVKQFWTDVMWGDVDFMFVDMPPGTGDVPLTVFQSLPVDGIIIVTSPQELVGMIVEKAVNMARMMNVPVLGIVENMSYFVCDHCGQKHDIFGPSHLDEIAARHEIPLTARMPIDPGMAAACDTGKIEMVQAEWLEGFADALEKL